MISGADVRKYRKTIGMGQVAFAQRLGMSQSTLSVLEGGRIAVSEDHLARLRESFDEPGFKPRFSDFVRELESQAALGQAALAGSEGRFLTLAVYAWEEGFDLSRPPSRAAAAGLVTIRATEQSAIAFEMSRRTEAWEKGEILVFERCEPNDVADGDLVLVQIRKPRARGPQTMIATVRVGRTTHGRTYGFEPVSPASSPFAEGDVTIAALLQLIFRARDLRER